MIWEGQSVVFRTDIQVPKTFREARKDRLVPTLTEDLEIIKRPIHLPVLRRLENGGLELLLGQKRVAANDKAKLESFPAEIVVCTDDEADYIREAENTHRKHNETAKDRKAWNESSLSLVEKRKRLLEAQLGKPVPKAAAIEEVARERGIKAESVAQQNRRERRKKDKPPKAPKRAVTGDEIAAVFDPQPPDPLEFAFDFLETEEREDILEYTGKVHALLLKVAEHSKAAEEALVAVYALSGEDQNPDPQLTALDGYTVVLAQLHDTALATLPRSICPTCKGSDSTCETCGGSIWVP